MASAAATVGEIITIYKSLPQRPSMEEVEAAISVLQSVETEQSLQLELISKQLPSQNVSPELFSVLLEVKRSMVLFQSLEQRKEAMHLVELDRIFQVFDGLIMKASSLVSPEEKKDFDCGIERNVVSSEMKSDALTDQHDMKPTNLIVSSSGGGKREKLDLMKVAAVIERFAKEGARVLDLQGKLMEKIEWLPLSIGKLSTLTELYISENRIMALPTSIGNLKALMKLDAHSNQIINLPNSFGELQNLTHLDVSVNMLKSLPESFGNLKNLSNLDLSWNRFSTLPDTIGSLSCLQKLNVERNNLEELPYTIGLCSSLLELRLDFNELKALPDATGKLEHLEILTLHYNRIKKLPTTMGNLLCLKELDVSFNELESIPETLCFEVSLEKLNVGENFADLRNLPESIGSLEMLEELDISDNQIKVLPNSFRLLSKLRNFRADQTPLEVPPKEITKLGAKAVVQYMADFVAGREVKSREAKQKRGFCSYICPFLCFGIEN